MMSVRAVDQYGNTTIEPLSIEVYAPIPTISSVTSTGTLFG